MHANSLRRGVAMKTAMNTHPIQDAEERSRLANEAFNELLARCQGVRPRSAKPLTPLDELSHAMERAYEKREQGERCYICGTLTTSECFIIEDASSLRVCHACCGVHRHK